MITLKDQTVNQHRVECADCGHQFQDAKVGQAVPRTPCPKCGKTARKLSVQIADTVHVTSEMKGVGYTGSKSKWFAKFHDKLELFRRTGRLHRVKRSFNKRTDQYDELIRDEQTKTVIRNVSEPLSQHRGHGSARDNQNRN